MHRYLALTGVAASLSHIRDVATPALDALKRKHFPNVDPDGAPLVLHRSDYLAAKGDFHPLAVPANHNAFVADLEAYLRATAHCAITVVLDKEAMLRKAYWTNKEPYHYCAEVMVEKFVQYLERVDGVGDVFAESRKDKKNAALQRAFTSACENGTRYCDRDRIAKRLTTFQIKFRVKRDNTTGIQIADTYAKPSFDRIMFHRDKNHPRQPFSERIGALLHDRKYDRSQWGMCWGYGMKYLP